MVPRRESVKFREIESVDSLGPKEVHGLPGFERQRPSGQNERAKGARSGLVQDKADSRPLRRSFGPGFGIRKHIGLTFQVITKRLCGACLVQLVLHLELHRGACGENVVPATETPTTPDAAALDCGMAGYNGKPLAKTTLAVCSGMERTLGHRQGFRAVQDV
jgi:hypothetical protein